MKLRDATFLPEATRAASLASMLLALALMSLSGACGPKSFEPELCCTPARGVTLVDWTRDGYGTAEAAASVRELVSLGANILPVVVTAYQEGVSSSTLQLQDPRTPSPFAVRTVLEEARAEGLDVALTLQVDLDDGSWRGRASPADPGAWFASYRDFLLPWAALAESVDAKVLVVGTELAGTIDREDEWRKLIAQVRRVFSGTLTYAASWDEAERVPFWDALDRIGVDAYFPVTRRVDAGRFEIVAGWQPWIERLDRLHRRAGRLILFTEIGYRSIEGAGMHPFVAGSSGAVDLEEQADLYWAALRAIAPHSWIEGVYWWNWPVRGAETTDGTDYTPRDKPAENELRAAWSSALETGAEP